jgi:hypothetical protein
MHLIRDLEPLLECRQVSVGRIGMGVAITCITNHRLYDAQQGVGENGVRQPNSPANVLTTLQ